MQAERAGAYRELFEKVGHVGLADLSKDKDTGLALQASWELHKKLIKGPKRPFLPSDTYDPNELKKFLDFLESRTKAPLPEWWVTGISELAVEKGRSHLYTGTEPKRKEIKVGGTEWRVGGGVALTLRDDVYSYNFGGVSLEYSKRLFLGAFDSLADVSGEKVTCLAAYDSASARCFPVVGFETKGGKRLWKAEVWATDKRDHFGPGAEHRAEMVTRGDTLFVFGAERSGLYLDAFELETGKCRFRFCTSYWRNYSEQWKLETSN